MSSNKKQLLTISMVAAAVLILGITATVVIIKAQSSRSSDLPVLGNIPSFELVESTGISFNSNEMKGKINVVDFFFTRCHGPCPVMSGHMSDLYQAFEGTDKVQFVSISVDPENDELPVLQDYARRQGVSDNRWVFLRGEMETVQWVSESGFMLAADDLPGAHSTKFVLVDDKGQIRGYYSGTDKASMNVLKTHIRDLVQNLL
jgi:protein SCO1/2